MSKILISYEQDFIDYTTTRLCGGGNYLVISNYQWNGT